MDYSQYEAEIYAKLKPPGDPSRSAFTKNYMKSQLEFLTIKVPVMRQIAREGFSFADLRGIAFSAATERFSAAERGALIERRKALRARNKILANPKVIGGETA